MNGTFKQYYYTILTCYLSCVSFLYFQNDLASGAKFGALSPGLGF